MENVQDLLLLLASLVAWTILNYLVAILFIRAVAFLGRRIRQSRTLKDHLYLF